jgi:DNA repair exonuclease SbcCD ATPase subunit
MKSVFHEYMEDLMKQSKREKKIKEVEQQILDAKAEIKRLENIISELETKKWFLVTGF